MQSVLKRVGLGLCAAAVAAMLGATAPSICWAQNPGLSTCCGVPLLSCGTPPNDWPCNGTTSGSVTVRGVHSAGPGEFGNFNPNFTSTICTVVTYQCGPTQYMCINPTTVTGQCRDYSFPGTTDCSVSGE